MRIAIAAAVALAALSGCSAGEESSPDSGLSAAEKEQLRREALGPAKPIDAIQSAVDDSDAEGPTVSRGLVRGAWVVEFDVQDNLGAGAIQGGIAMDVFDMAEEISQTDVDVREVTFRGVFPLVDKYGNESSGQVFVATLTGADIRKINYGNIATTELDLVDDLSVDGVSLHPDLQD